MSRRKSKTKKQKAREEKILALIEKIQPTAAVLALPHEATKEQKEWWNPYIGDKFRDALATRGKKEENGVTWVHDLFVGGFCNQKYGHLSTVEREQYYQLIGDSFYQYLTNHTNTGKAGVTAKPPPPPKIRAYGYDVWARDQPDQFQRIKQDYLKSNPRKKGDVGDRSLMSALFKLLPPADRTRYTNQARDELAATQALCLLLGDERDRYNEALPRRFRALMKEVETCSNALVNCHLLTEDSAGNFTIASIASERLKDFQTSEANGRALNAMKTWMKSVSNGKRVEGVAPRIAVYSDDLEKGFPRLPEITGVKVKEAQSLFRVYVTMIWMFMGGTGKVPWEEIQEAIDKWIAPERRPDGAVWKDPSSLTFAQVLVWLEHFAGCQDGTVPPEKRFQFLRVFAGLHPIAPGLSQEVTRKRVRRGDKPGEIWLLVFDAKTTITQCHQPQGMKYPDSGKAYAGFLAGNFLSESVAARPEWHGLPSCSKSPSNIIDDDTKVKILERAENLPEDAHAIVLSLLNIVNEHQHRLPASNPGGPWAEKCILPALLPETAPADITAALRSFLLEFWPPKSYFGPPSESGNSTIAFFEVWQQKALVGGTFHHEPSGTLFGGSAGVVWVVASLLKLVLTFAALRGDISPPVELGEEYDASRVPLGEWQRLLTWCRHWIARLERDVETLGKTSQERQQASHGELPVPSSSSSSEPALPLPTLGPIRPTKTPGTSKKKALPSKRKAKKSRGSDESDAGSTADDESSGEGDTDWSEKDKSDDDSEESDGEHTNADTDLGKGGKEDEMEGEDEKEEEEEEPGSFEDNHQVFPSFDSSIHAPHSPPRSNSPIPHVFGSFTKPPVPKKPASFPHNYPQILAALTKYEASIETTLRAWYKKGTENAKLVKEEKEMAAVKAPNFPLLFRPLYEFVHSATLAWKRASEDAPAVFQFSYDLSVLISQSMPVTAASFLFRQRYQNLDRLRRGKADSDSDSDPERGPDPITDRIVGLEASVNSKLAELRWLDDDLHTFEKLSSKWATKLAAIWPPAETPEDLPSLLAIAGPLLDWATEFDQAESQAIEMRKTHWRGLAGLHDETRTQAQVGPCYYFGCPRVGANLTPLTVCLREARLAVSADALGAPPDSSRTGAVADQNAIRQNTTDAGSGAGSILETTPGTTSVSPSNPNDTNMDVTEMETEKEPPSAPTPSPRRSSSDTPPDPNSQMEDAGDPLATKSKTQTQVENTPDPSTQADGPPASKGRKVVPPATRTMRSQAKAAEPPAHSTRTAAKRPAADNKRGAPNGGVKRRKK